jgi:hypothetical protein
MAKKQSTTRFPKEVYVTWEDDPNDDDGGYLSVDTTPDGAEHGASVGVYALREIRKMKITRELKK